MMDYNAFLASGTFTYAVLPFLIFLSRICDVTLDTLRIIYVSRGMRYAAPLLGFFEVLIWLIAITQIMKNLASPIHYIAYAGGFGFGNFVGIKLEEKLSVGTVMVRIITRKDPAQMITHLRAQGYGVTSHEACGETSQVNIVFTVVKRSEIAKVVSGIKSYHPNAFYTIEDVRYVSEAAPQKSIQKDLLGPLSRLRKSR
jgi:uncharacterized protein YebE (UPF0316 family)